MGTHPIFESDFDCLTAILRISRRLMKLVVGKDDNPVSVLSAVFAKSLKSIENGSNSKLILDSGSEVTNTPTMARLMARTSKEKLYSDDLLTASEIDHFIRLGDKLNFNRDAKILNDTLLLRTFVTGKEVTVADFLLRAYIRDSRAWNDLKSKENLVNIERWYGHIGQMEQIKSLKLADPKMTAKGVEKEAKVTAGGRKQE